MGEKGVYSIPEEEDMEEGRDVWKKKKKRIPLLEKITFERWDSLPDIWSSTMPKSKNTSGLPALRSASLSDLLEDEVVTDVKINTKEKMSRDHWQKGGLREKCNGCQRQIAFLFKRHHCRMCGKIFCHNCSRFKRRLSLDSKPNPDGEFHRVCLYCVKDENDGAIGFHKSWTGDFLNMRQAAHARKCEEKEPELKLLCEIPKICFPVTDLFLADITKGKQINVKGKLRSAVKAATRRTECSTCMRQLLNPKDRKECVFCGDIFCDKCSTKHLVVYYPRGEVQVEDIAEGKIQPTMDFFKDGMDMSSIADIWRNYRTCLDCEKFAEHELHVFHFNSRLRDYHRELMDTASQIVATLDRALQLNVEETSLNHAKSMDDLSQVPSTNGMIQSTNELLNNVLFKYEEKIAEERVTQKLFDRYWAIFNCIKTKLKAVTNTQAVLQKHIVSASSSFYSQQRWHFRVRYDSNVSNTSDD